MTVLGALLHGVTGYVVSVEAALPRAAGFAVDLPTSNAHGEAEARVRVRAALSMLGAGASGRILATCASPIKHASCTGLDLPLALEAAGVEVPPDMLLFGELSLSGALRAPLGVVPVLDAARRDPAIRTVIVPRVAAPEAAIEVVLAEDPTTLRVFLALTLEEVVDHLRGVVSLPELGLDDARAMRAVDRPDLLPALFPALEVVLRSMGEQIAAGTRRFLLIGPPGSGKTMLARRLPRHLPAPTSDEARLIARIASAAGRGAAVGRPFRAPHHSVSRLALIGGGGGRTGLLRPGEVTLAYAGTLFVDELPELGRLAFEGLRDALLFPRAALPSSPALIVAAANPCPCGWRGSPARVCACPTAGIERYGRRLEGFARALGLVRVEVPFISARDRVAFLEGGAL